jgi:NADPH:quinone reductase-like Zn-dependent oxidoreductase
MTMTKQDTMRAIVQREYGSAETLEMTETGIPTIAADEVLVEVHAAGVDRGVWHLMMGLPYLIRGMGYGFTRPKTPIPGFDVSGSVVGVGSDVTRFGIGDEVFGIATGAFAEYAAAKERKLVHKPANLSHAQAGVAAISGITALQGLVDVANVQAGQRVLVIGASGGVGTYAVQIAKALGAEVTGVASGGKLDMVRALGADDVVDYTTTDYLDGSTRYDVILDIGGLNPLRRLRKALTKDGTLVIVGGEGGGRFTGGIGRQLRAVLLSPFVSQRLTMFISSEAHTNIERLAEFLADERVRPAVGQRYALEDVPAAIADLEAGKTSGKSVIVVRGEGAGHGE